MVCVNFSGCLKHLLLGKNRFAYNTMLNTLLFQKIIWLSLILLTYLSGCVAMSDFLSGPSSTHDSSFEPAPFMNPIQIGVSTKEDVIGMLRNSTDRQIHSENENQIESWGYASQDEIVIPYQYMPFIVFFNFAYL